MKQLLLNTLRAWIFLPCLTSILVACATASESGKNNDFLGGTKTVDRALPTPAPDHPGNIFLLGEDVTFNAPAGAAKWRMLDDAGKTVAEGTGQAVCAGKLGIGWYRAEFGDAQGNTQGWTTAAVLAPLTTPTPQDSPICLDSATAWFASDDPVKQERFARLAALAGANWIRDRMSWSGFERTKGEFARNTTYDSSADVQSQHGLKTLQVFHHTPGWASRPELDGPNPGSRFPRDLRDEYAFCKAMAKRFKGRVQAWEPWNEANIPNFGGHTIDEMCSLQKAAYWGLKAGEPEVIACWNVFAGGGSTLHTEGVLKNEAWPYFDTYNIHTYDPPRAYLKEFANARDAASGRPIWLSECGIGLHFIKDSSTGELTPDQEQEQARFIARSYASSLYAGVSRHFFFILGNYLENVNQFGLLRHDQTPRPGYVALAAVGRLLAGARPLGQVLPQGLDGPYVYAFRAYPDGEERDVLVLWSEKPMDNPVKPPAKLESVHDYLGREVAAQWPAKLDMAAFFVVAPKGASQNLHLESPPPLSGQREGRPSPIVMQVQMPVSAVRLDRQAYEIAPEKDVDVPIILYNFGSTPATGSIHMEEIPAAWRASVDTGTLQLAPMERKEIPLHIRLSAQGPETTSGGWITLRGDFGAADRPVLSFRLLTSSKGTS